MTPTFPTEVKRFVTKVNLVNPVNAEDINAIQDEITATQETLGAQIKTQFIGLFAVLSRYRGTGRITHTTGDTITLEATGMFINNRFCKNTATITRDLATDISASTNTTYYVYVVDDGDGTFSLKFRTSSADNFTGERKIGSVHTAVSGSPPDIVFALDDDDSTPYALVGPSPVITVDSENEVSGLRINILNLVADTDTLFRLQYAGATIFKLYRNGDIDIEGDNLRFTGTAGNIFQDIATSLLTLAGGNSASNGAHIKLYGGTHATLAKRVYHNAQQHHFRRQDGDATEFVRIDFNTAATPPLVVTGTVDGAAFFNVTSDGDVVLIASNGDIEGIISVSGSTVTYGGFCGSHYTQLKAGQAELPIGAVVINTGEIIPSVRTVESEVEVSEAGAVDIIIKQAAIESVDVDVDDKDDIITYDSEYDYDPETDTEKETRIPVYGKKTIRRKQLKAGVGFNKKTREFYSLTPGVEFRSGKYYKKEYVIDSNPNKEYFPYIDTTDIAGDKRVYGVWFSKLRDDSNGMSFGENGKPVYSIAQAGLFKIRVTDTNGNVENGDYLETSTRPMEAQRQIDPARVNSSIAKAMVDADWSTVAVDPALGYKWKLIPITF